MPSPEKKTTLFKIVARFLTITMVVILTVSFFLLNYNQTGSYKSTVTRETENINDVFVNSMKFAMENGATDIHPFIDKMKSTQNLVQLKVTPSDKIKAGSEQNLDGVEKEVITSRQPKLMEETFEEKSVLRKVTPILAEQACTSCHQAAVGEPLAVVSIRFSLEKMKSDLAKQRILSAILGILTILLVLGIMMNFVTKRINRPVKRVLEAIKELSKGHLNARAQVDADDEIGEMAKTVDDMASNLEAYSNLLDKVARGDLSTKSNATDEDDTLAKAYNSILISLQQMLGETEKLTKAAMEGKLSVRGNDDGLMGGYKAIITGVNAIIDSIVVPIQESGDVLKKIAEGDLTVRMSGEYRGDYNIIKSNINLLAESFESALSEVHAGVQATANASAEISSSSEQMSEGSQNQSAQTSEVAAAVEEMTKTILSTTQNTTEAAEAARNAGRAARQGGTIVEQTIEGMNKIADVVSQSASVVQTLGKSSDQIGEIIQVIDDIADQTNLLALNAAIEAARAGEQGRGFAVFADEVRKLAERTSKATKEIADTIKRIQTDTIAAVDSMNRGEEEIEKGRRLAGEAGQSLGKIIVEAEQVVDIISQVAAASEQQSATSEEISQSIEKINNVTKETASGIGQIARSSEDLNNLASNLQDLVAKFKIRRNTLQQGSGGRNSAGYLR